jgi:hypothetical protein
MLDRTTYRPAGRGITGVRSHQVVRELHAPVGTAGLRQLPRAYLLCRMGTVLVAVALAQLKLLKPCGLRRRFGIRRAVRQQLGRRHVDLAACPNGGSRL